MPEDKNIRQAMDFIDAIGITSKRTDKLVLLTRFVDECPIAVGILDLAYNPFLTFGITLKSVDTHIGQTSAYPGAIDFQGIVSVFDQLIDRKITGANAAELVSELFLDAQDHERQLLIKIIDKDLNCGIGASTINKVAPGLIPQFKVMRAELYNSEMELSWPQIIEPKIDGFRFVIIYRYNELGIFTRAGKQKIALQHLVEPMRRQFEDLYSQGVLSRYGMENGMVIDTEAVAGNDFSETAGAMTRHAPAENVIFNVFEIMTYKDWNKVGHVNRPYRDRRINMEQLLAELGRSDFVPVPRYYVNSHEEVMDYYHKFYNPGVRDGGILKSPNSPYEKKKSKLWLKVKARDTLDLTITGCYEGEPHTKYVGHLGGVTCNYKDVEIRVGGGWSDTQRELMWEKHLEWQGKTTVMPVEHPFIGRIIEVNYQEVTKDGSLRHPSFKSFRDDKPLSETD